MTFDWFCVTVFQQQKPLKATLISLSHKLQSKNATLSDQFQNQTSKW